MPPIQAVAVDLGATSARYAAGWIEDGRIRYEIIEQVEHEPVDWCGQIFWDMDVLMRFCKRALLLAQENEATIGFDSWAVDQGFLNSSEKLLMAPVCYRDLSHERVFRQFEGQRPDLYQATGIQHQPFNTFYQLFARAQEVPEIRDAMWLMLPDLIGCLLGAPPHVEMTNASTTQLVDAKGEWCREAFDMIGWPVPELPISKPGRVLIDIETARLAIVGSHDTASAVFGLGPIMNDQAYMSIGTWSLLGCLLDEANLSDPGFTNERAVDGRIRYLANVPGFYVINRVHEELGVRESVPEWLAKVGDIDPGEGVDLMDQRFFNPVSMAEELRVDEFNSARVALASLVRTSAAQVKRLEANVGRSFTSIRACGGGSESEVFCRALANATGKRVIAGPKEATILGNLAVQFYADDLVDSLQAASELAARSFEVRVYEAS